MTDWLIDKSALVRIGSSPQAAAWADRIDRGLVRICTVTRLEIGYSARGGEDHYRERAYAALFLDEAPDRAVWLAAQNWRELKEPLDARLLLTSAGAAGETATAAPVLDWIQRFDVQDARLRALAAALKDPS